MKKLFGIVIPLIVAVSLISCEDHTFDLDYKAPLSISFTGVDNTNLVILDKGVTGYSAKIEVKAPETGIKYFELYMADPKTGAKGSLIENTAQSFDDGQGNGVPSYSFEYVMSDLTATRCIKVVVTDAAGNSFEKNLVVKISPVVLFSSSMKMETVEVYYGPYFASWLGGRVYMRRDGEAYKNEIDFSLGDVVIPAEGETAVPALVNPAVRSTLNLLTLSGLQQVKYELTTLTKAQYDAISEVDAAPINALADPTQDAVKLVKGKVYLFKTASGKKGLIHLADLSSKTGTVESATGEWVKNTAYSQATLTAKVAVQ